MKLNELDTLRVQLLDEALGMMGKAPLSKERSLELIRKGTNVQTTIAWVYRVLDVGLVFSGGMVVGVLLGFPGLKAGAAALVLRLVLGANLATSRTKNLKYASSKLLTMACAEASNLPKKDLFPGKGN
jgi:hypothetical protein